MVNRARRFYSKRSLRYCSHIHFGAVRLALNYHGTARKPVVARIALLDSRYLEYQNACIATVEATLNTRLVMVTLFLNFTMALVDPNLLSTLQVQIQIVGAPQHGTNDSLMISVNTEDQPHCVHIPRKIPKQELIQLLPEKWAGKNPSIFPTQLMMQPIGNPTEGHDKEDLDCCCDLCDQGSEKSLVQSFDANGRALYQFKDEKTGHYPWDLDCACPGCIKDRSRAWFDDLDNSATKPRRRKKKSSQSEFYKRYMYGDPSIGPLGEDNGKFVYLVDYSAGKTPPPKPEPQLCKPQPPPLKPSSQNPFSQPCYRKINKWVKKNPDFLKPSVEIPAICMIQPTSSSPEKYEKDFPPLEEFSEKNYTHVPKIPSKLQPETSGATTRISAAKATLNWQTENALAQNHVLKKMDSKLFSVEAKLDDNTKMIKDLIQLLQKRIESIAREPAAPGQDFFSHLAQREKEIQKLKAQIKELQETGKIPELVKRPDTIELFPSIRQEPSPSSEGISITFSKPIKRTKPSTYEIFLEIKKNEAEKKKKEKETKKAKDQEKAREPVADQEEKKLGKRPVLEEFPPPSPPKQVSKSLMIQEKGDKNPLTTFLKDCHKNTISKISTFQIQETPTSEEEELSTESSDEFTSTHDESSTENEPESILKIQVTTKVEEHSDEEMEDKPESSTTQTSNAPHKSPVGRTFTLDDLPPERWPERLQEFHSWLETKKLTEESNYNILIEFVSRFTRMLRDWWNSINRQHQMQFLVLQNLSEPIKILHQHFIRNLKDLFVLKRREFYARKCCCYKKKDLTKHFKKMFQLFCTLGLHHNLKPVILSSLPAPIQVAVNQTLQRQNKDIIQLTIGEIQQEVFIALEDICNRRKIFKDYLHGDRRLDQAYDESHLKFKCLKEKHCDCRIKKKKHYKRFPEKPLKRKPRWRYLRKKRRFSKKSNRCYICNQKGYFAKDCPKNKKKKVKKIIQMIFQSGVKMKKKMILSQSVHLMKHLQKKLFVPFQFMILKKANRQTT
ncbi:hypothetical protein CXB51_022610 [Gossypium anomalum]|uniref:CCHC-type domain-containing protein n=1 Tax=Gossypium anomalum TaxID=47600 RepID=A0A8J6CVI2_9ROSI|nr:hypothetical protein CXB51_022610 [Gossypium anomalum]